MISLIFWKYRLIFWIGRYIDRYTNQYELVFSIYRLIYCDSSRYFVFRYILVRTGNDMDRYLYIPAGMNQYKPVFWTMHRLLQKRRFLNLLLISILVCEGCHSPTLGFSTLNSKDFTLHIEVVQILLCASNHKMGPTFTYRFSKWKTSLLKNRHLGGLNILGIFSIFSKFFKR